MAETLLFLLRLAVLAAFIYATLIALAAWAVRNGKLSPFSAVARTARRLGDPILKGLERRLVRSGANPQDAPLWLFWIALIGGLVVLGLTEWLIGVVTDFAFSASAGPRGIALFLLSGAFTLLTVALFLRVIASWFQLSPYSPLMRLVLALTDWMIVPLRRIVPPFGMIDVTPLVAYILLLLARSFLFRLL
ncbi:MAG: YggT family protein [Gemmatimonadales bacterium]